MAAESFEYSWQMQHPKHGWLGGDESDEWHDTSDVPAGRAALCDYPTRIVQREVIVRPSKRGRLINTKD